MAAELLQKKQLHVVMVPWLAFGHMIPHLEVSKAIAANGHKVSFVSTPRNIDRLPKLPSHLSSNITLVKIPLPKVSGLPEHAEATKDISDEHNALLKTAYDGLETGLTRFLEESKPDWIIYDFSPHWLPSIAARLGISRGFFYITDAWFLAFWGPSVDGMINNSDYGTKIEDFTTPPKWAKFDTKVAFRRYEAKWMVWSRTNSDSHFTDYYRAGKAIEGCEAIFLRSCPEFEPRWLNLIEEVHGKPVIPIGFMPPKLQHYASVEDEKDESWVKIRTWLDGQDKGSVVYVALGSEVSPTQDQLNELAHGLELSGVPFFFVLHKSVGLTGSVSLELPDGFEERTSGRGIVWRSWAPQMKILSHESMGGFLTHCGWSSIVEALMFGHPLIGLPFMADQGLNSRVVVEKELGFEIPRNEEDGSYTRDSVAEALKLLMLQDEGKKFKERAKEMRSIFGNTELHDRYLENFVKFLENHKSS